MHSLDPKALARRIVEGVEQQGGAVARALNSVGYVLPPLPNLFFPRDIGIVIGGHTVVGSMRHGVRWTEELLIKTLFAFHPALGNEGLLYDGSEERRSDYTLEGGDIHVVRPDLLIIGFSERSSPAAIDHLTEVLFERTGVTDVLVVVMPKEPTAIHLDMLFTQVDRELCVVYPPYFLGPERLAVLHGRRATTGSGRCRTSSPPCAKWRARCNRSSPVGSTARCRIGSSTPQDAISWRSSPA